MKPYYEHEGIQIYHGDCRDIMPSLTGTVISDPPYNVGYHYDGYKDNLVPEEYQEMLKICCRPQSVIIHYAEDLCALSWTLQLLPSKIVAWVYNSNTPRQWRGVAWFGTTPDFTQDGQEYKNPQDKRIATRIAEGQQARLYDWWQIDQIKNVSKEKTAHPCQIPVSLMRRILKITPKSPIIDPFCGSGSTLLAAKELGFHAIGIERNEAYAEISAKRLAQELLFT